MRLYLLECGAVEIGRDLLIPNTGRTGRITVPVPALLVQAGRDTYLIDTGMPDFWIDRGESLDGADIFPRMSGEDAITARLASVGVAPQDLTCVISTHLHFDHAGGNAHFTAVPILVQETELEAARARNGVTWPGWDVPGLRYETIKGDYHVCSGLDLLLTPGHTLGHQSVLITLDDGQRLLFTIDAVYTAINWAEDALGAMTDPVAGQVSVERLRREAALPATTVIFGHDPDQWQTLRRAPDFYGTPEEAPSAG